jgi:3-dehydroquinate synthase
MQKIAIQTARPYVVKIENGLLSSAAAEISAVMRGRRTVIVTDDNVAPLYAEGLCAALKGAGFTASVFAFPHGEGHKTMETVTSLLSFLVEKEITRRDFLVALGGGIVGDVCGFAASIHLRGIPFVQIPSTLLAAVDSSVGGKTGVNLSGLKNQVGSFWQPSLVLCDPDTFKTLPSAVFADGMAEVIKYAVLFDRTLFEALAEDFDLSAVIARCVDLKRGVVEADERDNGPRQLLNLGHTVAHAIEKCADGEITHGSAVAMGMVIVTRAAVANGICKENFTNSLISLLKKHGLPTECPYSLDLLLPFMKSDKKRGGEEITLILPKEIGACVLHTVPLGTLSEFLKKGASL